MIATDDTYLRARAETHLASARKAASPEVSKIHYAFAGRYLDRLYGGDAPPCLYVAPRVEREAAAAASACLSDPFVARPAVRLGSRRLRPLLEPSI